MDTQPPSEQNLKQPDPNQASESLADPLQEQHLNLKLEVEQLYGKVERLRELIQTLVSGLILAIVIVLGISGWFAYRLLVQEQIVRRDAEKVAAAEAELRQQVTRMEEQLQSLKQQVPQELTTLTDTVQANQQQLKLLNNRLTKVETEASSQKDSG